MLDGEWNFELVASYLDYMFDNDAFPEMIVTGVQNVNRNRDYVPREDASFRDTGKADDFLEFVKEDWVDFIDYDYSSSQKRVLVGHSFGGVFTLHALFKEPELFDAYIALGSSAWIADRVLFEEADAFFADASGADAFVYMAVGEGDGGPTLPSSTDLAHLFEENAPESMDWTFDITPKTDHFKNFVSGMHDGFMALFPAWGFEGEVKALAEQAGAAGVKVWFAEKENALGFRFKPAWFDMGVTAIGLSRNGNGEAALALMKALRRHYPENAHVANFSATVYSNLQRFERAESEYIRAIAIARERGLHPNAIHIEQLERGLSRVRTLRSEK